MSKTTIESFVNPDGTPGHVWNPIWGCLNICLYCHARRIAKMYAKQIAAKEFYYFDNLEIKKYYRHLGYYSADYFDKTLLQMRLEKFKPTWLESNYVRKFPQKQSLIFVNSMSDPADWKKEWHERIVEKIKRYPQHTFVVLTKRPRIYKKYTFAQNCWMGVTVTNQIQLNRLECYLDDLIIYNLFFLSIEPIQEKIYIAGLIKYVIDWIIVGPETGRKNTAKAEWIEPFFDIQNIRVFMKNACSLYTDRPLRQEWPEGYMNV